jgi:hypothetical protein
LTFGFTFFVNNWIVSSGVKQVFIVIGGVNVAVCAPAFFLCTPPVTPPPDNLLSPNPPI